MDTDRLWRQRISDCCGGFEFDKRGGGYAFSAMIAAEEELARGNQPGNPTSALITMSVADPRQKMEEEAMNAGMQYYRHFPWSTCYTDNTGARVCEKAGVFCDTHTLIAAWLNKRFANGQTRFDRNWVQYSPQAIKGALAEILPTLLFEEGTKVVFPTPGYGVIANPKNIRGATVSNQPLVLCDGLWDLDLGHIGKVLLAKLGKRVAYINFPHNPTGAGYSKEQWQNIIAWAEIYGVTLIVDEAYTDLRYNDRTCSVLEVEGWENCCIVLQSVSKGWSATGLRFGWMVGHPTIIAAIREVSDVKHSGAFGPTIVAGLACLKHPEWADATRECYQQLHQNLFEGLEASGFSAAMPEAGLCQITPAPKSVNGITFSNSVECAEWLRHTLRVSVMAQTINEKPYLRWATTLMPVPECGLPTEESVIVEAMRRLKTVNFEF
ncbi:MAG: aminotransferase class I/II-fold pyridoxal phosphate-dependent enzyme [Patescibacteria group bacterium]|nr:aminotransferase class I/II-fold pyridoxal phosphate-dependent enzyme [Patescibacteria group bacterium]